jgi:hypothetical protein
MTCSCSSLLDTLERVKALLVCQETGRRPNGYVCGEKAAGGGMAWGSGRRCDCDAALRTLRILEAGDSPGTTSAGSFCKRALSRTENIARGVHVAVMMSPAIAARPLSYSKACDTFRPRLRDAPASRADLGRHCLVDFKVGAAPAPMRFVCKHLLEAVPAGVMNRFRHAGTREFLGTYVADDDQPESLIDQCAAGLVQEVLTAIRSLRMDGPGALRLARPLGSGESRLGLAVELGRFDHVSSRERGERLEAKVYPDRNAVVGRAVGFWNVHADVDVPATPGVGSEGAGADDAHGQPVSQVHRLKAVAHVLERGAVEAHVPLTTERHPAERATPTEADAPVLYSGLYEFGADRVEAARQETKVLAGPGTQLPEVVSAWQSARLLPGSPLDFVGVVPNEVDRSGLAVKERSVLVSETEAVGDDHGQWVVYATAVPYLVRPGWRGWDV